MVKGLLSIFIYLLFSGQMALSSSYKRTVCTATINSPEERQTFQEHLPKSDFDFVELTDFSSAQTPDVRGEEWFDLACESGVQCDVLIVSGHFGGAFFGDTGFTLSTNKLEKHSCQKSCDGILKQPKEVFLFGCNTLASKDQDHRSPEEYLQVLLEDQIDRAEAERIVEARYGSLGTSFKDRMQRVFEGVPRIYGFDSVGPSGKTVKPFLDKYFKETPDYKNHLLQFEGQQIIDLIDNANTKVYEMENTVLAEALKNTAFDQCSGINDTDAAYRLKQNICRLYSQYTSLSDKIEAIKEMLLSDDAFLYLPTIAAVLKREYSFFDSESIDDQALAELSSIDGIKEKLNQMITELENSPALKADLLVLSRVLGVLNQETYNKKMKKTLLPKDGIFRREDLDLICSVTFDLDDDLIPKVSLSDFKASQLSTGKGASAVGCLSTEDTRITKEVLKVPQNNDREFATKLNVLENMPGYDDEILALAKKGLQNQDEFARYSANLIMIKRAPIAEIESIMTEIGQYGFRDQLIFQYLSSRTEKSTSISMSIAKQALKEDDPVNRGMMMSFAVNIMPKGSPKWAEFLKAADELDQEWRSFSYGTLAELNPTSKLVGDWATKEILSNSNKEVVNEALFDVINGAGMSRESARQLYKKMQTAPDKQKRLIRWVLQEHEPSDFTSEELRFIQNGPISKFDCRTSENDRSFSTCGYLD